MVSKTYSIKELINFNPKRLLKKGEVSPFIEMAALPTSGRDLEKIEYKEFSGGGSKFTNGDTLFARITPCLENGKTAKVSGLPEGINGFGSTEFIVMSAKEPNYDQDYVYYLARLPEFRAFAKARMEGTSGRQRVAWQSLAEFEYRLPNKEKRKQIGNFLRSLDDKITLNTQTNKTLEDMAQAIFKSWFVDFDPVNAKMRGEQPEGMDAETAALFPDKLVESELGMIPEGWSVEPLKSVSKVINGRAYKNTEFKENGMPIVRIQNLTGNGKTVYSDLVLPEEKLIDHGDLIFAWSATFGPYLWRGPKSIYHYHIWKMGVDEAKFGKYLLYLHLVRLTDSLKNQGTGSIFTHLTKAIMENQKLIIPNEEIVKSFANLVSPLFSKIDTLHKQKICLQDIRDTLLPKLLSGEISLSEVEAVIETKTSVETQEEVMA